MSATVATGGSPRRARPASRTHSPVSKTGSKGSKSDTSLSPVAVTIAINGADADTNTNTENDTSRRPDAATDPANPVNANGVTAPGGEDYFSSLHGPSHFSLEPNPFEQSFGNPADTPGKSILPSVAALASPALPGATSSGPYSWANSLRAGPLSPAMLAGPAGPNEYFDNIGRGFPTPNESGLRTGLTPGGGGSMFPAPSPGPQSLLLQHLGAGNATPSTLDFHRTALAAARKTGAAPAAPTSNPQEPEQLLPQSSAAIDLKPGLPAYPFPHPDATDAANGLFMLAKGAQVGNNNFAPPPPTSHAIQPHHQQQQPQRNGLAADPTLATGTLPTEVLQNGNVALSNGTSTIPDSPETKTNGRTRAKRSSTTKSSSTGTAARRKTEEPTKSSNKKLKSSNGSAVDKSMVDMDDEDEEEFDLEAEDAPAVGAIDKKNMTDEEKKRNFKERNRVAALRCRQRKKQWVTELVKKVEIYTADNDSLSNMVAKLRNEVTVLKSILIAHKDCPIGQTQSFHAAVIGGFPNQNELASTWQQQQQHQQQQQR
ncbi:hypothetical protein FQN57_000394 [Myotisia sp. PD_48]|nr:hypothetical protein FQN57_000394 [Myotisia sp. PD_48]